jgi:hypothetical protein
MVEPLLSICKALVQKKIPALQKHLKVSEELTFLDSSASSDVCSPICVWNAIRCTETQKL